MYEMYNSQSIVRLETGFDFEKVYLCDMLENNICEIESDGRHIEATHKGFEIITLKFCRVK